MKPNYKKEKFESIAIQYMDSLYSTALRMTRNSEEAEDLVQDTYLRAYRFFDRFQEGTNFRAWIFKIMTNTFINRYRKQNRAPQKVELEKVEFGLESKEKLNYDTDLINYKSGMYDNMFDDKVNRALRNLSEDFRKIVILADVEGFSYKEIANMINVPIGTVMSRLFRGRKILQRTLGGYARRHGYVKEAIV